MSVKTNGPYRRDAFEKYLQRKPTQDVAAEGKDGRLILSKEQKYLGAPSNTANANSHWNVLRQSTLVHKQGYTNHAMEEEEVYHV